ncbi:F-box/WD repeat-containing protein 7, partial [Armadillidium nasatum]
MSWKSDRSINQKAIIQKNLICCHSNNTHLGSSVKSLSTSSLTPQNTSFSEAFNYSLYSSNNVSNLNNKNIADISNCSKETSHQNGVCRKKAYSLPHHYKPSPCFGSWRVKKQEESDQKHVYLSSPLTPQQFKQRFSLMKEWFNEFTDEQRNRVLVDLLQHIGPSQVHLLSVAIGHRLHEGCPPNCQDPISYIPAHLALIVFSYLDPVSLARASQVCKSWYKVIMCDYLWKRLSNLEKWSLSSEANNRQVNKCLRSDGSSNWRQVFIERFRLRRNWLGAHCHIRTFEGHEEGVSCVQFDDSRIVSGSHDNTIKVWNRRTNSQWSVQTLVGHSGMVRCLHLADKRIVSGSADRTIKVWDVEETTSWSSITCKVTLVGHTDIVRCLQVKGDTVVSGSYDKSVRLWTLASGQCKMIFLDHNKPVLTVAFDERLIVSGAADTTIKLWDIQTGECLKTLEGHKDAITTLAFDSSKIISGSLDCTIRIWCLEKGLCVKILDWMSSEGHTDVIRCLAADSWRIVSASDDKTIKVWDRHAGRRIMTLRDHT